MTEWGNESDKESLNKLVEIYQNYYYEDVSEVIVPAVDEETKDDNLHLNLLFSSSRGTKTWRAQIDSYLNIDRVHKDKNILK